MPATELFTATQFVMKILAFVPVDVWANPPPGLFAAVHLERLMNEFEVVAYPYRVPLEADALPIILTFSIGGVEPVAETTEA